MDSPAQEVPSTPTITRDVFHLSQTPVALVPDDVTADSQDYTFSVPGTPFTPLVNGSPWLQRSTPRSLRSGTVECFCLTPTYGQESPWQPMRTPRTGKSIRMTPRLLVCHSGAASPSTQVVPATPTTGVVPPPGYNQAGTCRFDQESGPQHLSPCPGTSGGQQQDTPVVVDASGDQRQCHVDHGNRKRRTPYQQTISPREVVARFRRSPEAKARTSTHSTDFLDLI